MVKITVSFGWKSRKYRRLNDKIISLQLYAINFHHCNFMKKKNIIARLRVVPLSYIDKDNGLMVGENRSARGVFHVLRRPIQPDMLYICFYDRMWENGKRRTRTTDLSWLLWFVDEQRLLYRFIRNKSSFLSKLYNQSELIDMFFIWEKFYKGHFAFWSSGKSFRVSLLFSNALDWLIDWLIGFLFLNRTQEYFIYITATSVIRVTGCQLAHCRPCPSFTVSLVNASLIIVSWPNTLYATRVTYYPLIYLIYLFNSVLCAALNISLIPQSAFCWQILPRIKPERKKIRWAGLEQTGSGSLVIVLRWNDIFTRPITNRCFLFIYFFAWYFTPNTRMCHLYHGDQHYCGSPLSLGNIPNVNVLQDMFLIYFCSYCCCITIKKTSLLLS